MSEDRPDPDALLASLNREEARAKRGQLKVFFGMCPGVGKTFAMLRAGQKELHDGVDAVVGVVETHKRVETEALLAGLPVIPRKQIDYRGAALTEMDLEAIIAHRPKLALVDELAHTNAPGSRHPKRWQDVIELIEAGIDVYSTLNVQHIESRSDAVRQITGAPVHETVPDSVLDLADEIELIDLTPSALRERLQEGKVYMGERAAAARDNFFQEEHLTALRELALRFTAERVDRQLREMRSGDARRIVWRSGERLLVAVGASPFSTQLVRWTRRMSAALGAPWIAVHIETSRTLSPEGQRLLDQNLALARELGAEVVVTHDEDMAAALVRVARVHNATQIVVGKPRGNRWRDWLRGGSLVDRLARLGGEIDIYMVPAEEKKPRRIRLEWVEHSSLQEYLTALGVIVGVTVASWFIADFSGYHSVGMLYLLAVIALSLRVGRGPVLLAGVLSGVAWDYFFIPPRFTFVIGSFDDAMLCFVTVAVALVSGQLTARIRAQSRNERMREARATALFELTRVLAGAKTLDDAIFAALRQTDELFGAQTALALADEAGGALVPHFAGSYMFNDKERGVAEWAFRNKHNAGRFTDTLPGSVGYYLPLLRDDNAVGVLGVKLPPEKSLTLAQRDLLEAFARQLALSVERENLRAAGEREKLLAESEKLHRVLFDSVSHELRTPLAVISSIFENLKQADPALRDNLVNEGRTAVTRLNRLVKNLLDQTRLESGALKPSLKWCGAHDLVTAALQDIRDALAGHPLDIVVPDDMPPVRADFSLTEQALANLLLNAALHTPVGTSIFLTTGIERGGQRVYFTVADRGPGFPPAMRERLFKKFARGDAARAGGLGLGLSIVRGFIVAQGGEVVVGENPGGGAVITIYLPHSAPDDIPKE
ncbi:MAG TPA: sensor histidine kinase KdpD [Opitutaceae bacterium]|nr:sensor histidine kinase KdpD [Opitutaceae bacterium]